MASRILTLPSRAAAAKRGAVPYSPIHSKQCVIDEQVVLDGSFNWYNTSVLSHDLMVVVNHREVARLYLEEARQILEGFRVVWISLAR